MFIGLRRNAIAVRSNRNGGDGEIEKVTVCMRGSPRLRKSCRQTWADLAPSQHKTHYVTSPHSAKPRRWPPDTCGMAFEKLILTMPADHGFRLDDHQGATPTRP